MVGPPVKHKNDKEIEKHKYLTSSPQLSCSTLMQYHTRRMRTHCNKKWGKIVKRKVEEENNSMKVNQLTLVQVKEYPSVESNQSPALDCTSNLLPSKATNSSS